MRVVYIAEDGKQFKSEYECEEYETELQLSRMNGIIKGVDEMNNPIDVRSPNIDEVSIWYASSDDAAKMLKFFLDRGGLVTKGIEKAGVYIWSNENYCWMPISDIMNQHLNAIEKLNRTIDLVTKK